MLMNKDDMLPDGCAERPQGVPRDTHVSPRPNSGDAGEARGRILAAALRLFVDKGYASTPVREIVRTARVNIASVAYYFGDKAGLYRAVLNEPVQSVVDDALPFDAPDISLEEALLRYMRSRLLPLGQGETLLLNVRLRLREILEPTGMLDDERVREQSQQRLLTVLARELGLVQPDAGLHRLAFSIFSLVTYPYIGHEQIRHMEPALFDAPGAISAWIKGLTAYAVAMVDAERRQRAA